MAVTFNEGGGKCSEDQRAGGYNAAGKLQAVQKLLRQ